MSAVSTLNISAVLSGHDHAYERFQIGEMPAFVNGAGAKPAGSRNCYLNGEAEGVPPSEFCLDGVEGAMLTTADRCTLTFAFYTHDGQLRDSVTLRKC